MEKLLLLEAKVSAKSNPARVVGASAVSEFCHPEPWVKSWWHFT